MWLTAISLLRKVNLWAVIVGLLILFIFFLWKDNQTKVEVIEGHELKDRIQERRIESWRDKEGKSRARALAMHGDMETLKNVLNKEFAELRNEFGKIKPKHIHSATKVLTVLRDSLNISLYDSVRIINDSTIRFFAFNYTDSSGYNKYRGEIREGKLILKPEIQVPLSTVIHKKRRAKRFFFDFFPRKEYVVEAKSDNPSVTITDLKAIAGKKTE